MIQRKEKIVATAKVRNTRRQAAKASENGAKQEAVGMEIRIPKIDLEEMYLTVVGDTSLIVHRFGQKTKDKIREKQTGQATSGKQPKDPKAEYEASMHRMPDGSPGFPGGGFKASSIGACRFADIPMTEARGAFHVLDDMVKIEGSPNMREDAVRIARGVTDLRYRAEFKEWRATFKVRYNTSAMSAPQIVNLFNIAGFGVGIGEWRPQKNGMHGMFHVENTESSDA